MFKSLKVRRDKVQAALKFLIENNKQFQRMGITTIDAERLSKLPEEGLLEDLLSEEDFVIDEEFVENNEQKTPLVEFDLSKDLEQ